MPNPAATYSGLDGFLGSRGSLMLDVVFLAMFAIVPVLGYSIYVVKYGRNYQRHKRIQIVLATVLLVAVTAFELDMRFFTNWQERAAPSPYFVKGEWNAVWISLIVHLAFAIPTVFLWIAVIVGALRGFPRPPHPSPHSSTHMLLGKLASIGMFLTAVTGWIFYWLAFVA